MNRKNTSNSVLLIGTVFLAVLMMSNIMSAQEFESNSYRKKPIFFISTIVAITSPAQESPTLTFGAKTGEVRKEGIHSYYYIEDGRIYFNDQETRGQEVYVQFEKSDGKVVHYSTLPVERADIGAYHKNFLLNASGFSAKIPVDDIPDFDARTIRFVMKNKSGIFKSQVWRLGTSSQVKIELNPTVTQKVNFGVQKGEKRKEGSHSYYFLHGWIYIMDQETNKQKVYVQFEKPDGTVVNYSTWSGERADIAAYRKNTIYSNSGFSASIPLEDISDIDECNIRFVVKNKSGIYKSKVWRYGTSSRVEIKLQPTESRAIKFCLDSNEERKEYNTSYRNIVGWVYVKGQKSISSKVFMQFEKLDGTLVYYSTIPTDRPDIGTCFNSPVFNAFGFSASIPQEDDFNLNAYKIRLVLRNKDGMFKSLAWKAGGKYGASSGKLTAFVAVNWLLVIIICLILIVTIWRDRSLLLKPSIMAILFFHVMCQWGTALEAGRIEQFLPRPWVFVLLSHGFPMIGLAVSLLIWRRPVRAIFGQVIDRKPDDLSRKNKALALLALFFVAFMLLYFSHVPFRTTGLYKIIYSPAESGMARDMSVKFLGNAFLRYGHNIMMAVFAPLMAALTIQILLIHWQRRNWSWMAFYLACLVVIFLAASISGARSYSAGIIMVILFALLLRLGFPLRPAYLVAIVLLILTFPTLLSLLREGKVVTAKNFFAYLRGSTFDRVVIIPMKTGLYHVQYAQQHGYFGIKAIPKLAAVAGVEPINVPDFIAKYMSGSPLDTSTANTAYIYAYYSYFGLIAFIPCLFGLWLLDLCLLVYRRLGDTMLIPCVASVAIGVNIFSSVEYTVGLVTFGILLLPLVSWAVDHAVPKLELASKKKISGCKET